MMQCTDAHALHGAVQPSRALQVAPLWAPAVNSTLEIKSREPVDHVKEIPKWPGSRQETAQQERVKLIYFDLSFSICVNSTASW